MDDITHPADYTWSPAPFPPAELDFDRVAIQLDADGHTLHIRCLKDGHPAIAFAAVQLNPGETFSFDLRGAIPITLLS